MEVKPPPRTAWQVRLVEECHSRWRQGLPPMVRLETSRREWPKPEPRMEKERLDSRVGMMKEGSREVMIAG